jgi:hypothetical protein
VVAGGARGAEGVGFGCGGGFFFAGGSWGLAVGTAGQDEARRGLRARGGRAKRGGRRSRWKIVERWVVRDEEKLSP